MGQALSVAEGAHRGLREIVLSSRARSATLRVNSDEGSILNKDAALYLPLVFFIITILRADPIKPIKPTEEI